MPMSCQTRCYDHTTALDIQPKKVECYAKMTRADFV